jgi:hypothetical protein
MIERVIAMPLRGVAAAACTLAFMAGAALAQGPSPGAAPYPGAAARNPACIRLEAQLATIDRGNYDPARAGDIKRLEDMAARQQSDLDRVTAQARRQGCEGRGFFSLFGGQPQQCGPINNQMQQLRANLDQTLGELQRTQGNSADREGQRRSVLAALGQSDCGPQYRAYANRGGFFENLFGPGPGTIVGTPDAGSGNTFRTLCVRTCDGYYFPISYSTVPGKFAEDEKVCQAMCPAAEVALYSHRNPGEDVNQAVSISGRNYTEMPNAFAYRKSFNPSCSCKGAGQTWADALKHLEDQTVERGDILVNEESARALLRPQTDAQGRPIRPPPAQKANPPLAKGKAASGAGGAPAQPAGATPADAPAATTDGKTADGKTADGKTADGEPGKRQVRTVGPTFFPVR